MLQRERRMIAYSVMLEGAMILTFILNGLALYGRKVHNNFVYFFLDEEEVFNLLYTVDSTVGGILWI